MKTTLMLAALAVVAFTAPTLALEQGMPTGSEAAGTPLNNSVTASGRFPETGHTAGYRARGQLIGCRHVTIRSVTPSGRIVYRTVRRCR